MPGLKRTLHRRCIFSLPVHGRTWHDLHSDFEMMEPSEPRSEKRFFPSGAIFFFALLILFYAARWLVIYWIMIARA
jgi:hypothetical protein